MDANTNIDGNMDAAANINSEFYDLLNDVSEEDSDNKICLISKELLSDNSVKLVCGHEFNYVPLYHEVKNQKRLKYYNNYNSKLEVHEMKCPYCRIITPQILPYFKYYKLELIKGVNMPQKHGIQLHTCQHILKTKKTICGKCACKTNKGVICNQHYQMTLPKSELPKYELPKPDISNIPPEYYTKLNSLKVHELKHMLRINFCKVGGKKLELIERIYHMMTNNNNNNTMTDNTMTDNMMTNNMTDNLVIQPVSQYI
jgi:hypothetical protein